MKRLEQQAALVAQHDAEFLARLLTGSKLVLKAGSSTTPKAQQAVQRGSSLLHKSAARHEQSVSGTCKGNSTSSSQQASPVCGQSGCNGRRSQQQSASGAAAAAAAAASSSERQQSAGGLLTSAAAARSDELCSHGEVGACNYVGPTDPAPQAEAAPAHSQQQQPQGHQHQQQEQAHSIPSCGSSKARSDSPSWLLKSCRQEAGRARAVTTGPLQADNDLYAAWAQNAGGAAASECGCDATGSAAATSPSWHERSGPLGVLEAPACQQQGLGGSRAEAMGRTSAACSPTAQLRSLAASPASAAAVLLGSPCGSNFHSSRAAGLAAGVARMSGAGSPEHKDWVWQQQQRPKLQAPPCRNDAQQVSTWVVQQLHELHQRLQQQLLLAQEPPQEAAKASPAAAGRHQHQLQRGQGQPYSSQPSAGATSAAQQFRSQSTAGIATGSSKPTAGDTLGSVTVTFGSSSSRGACGGDKSRSASPEARQRDDATSSAASPAGGYPAGQAGSSTALLAQTALVLQGTREAAAGLSVDCCATHESILTEGFQELCRQVSVACVERGAVLKQLWSTYGMLLAAALQDKQAAVAREVAANAATADALQEQSRLAQLQEDEKVALRAINERHAAKAEQAKQQYEQLKQHHTKLQDLLARLSGAQQLVGRVMELETANQQQVVLEQQLRAQLEQRQEELGAMTDREAHWRARAEAVEQLVQQQGQQLGCSTPRPRRDLGLLCDLLEPHQQQLVEQALIAGVPAESVHRLLLGLSPEGQDMRPWLQLAGSCVPALTSAADPLALHHLLCQALVYCDAASLAQHVAQPDHLQLLSQAVHLGTPTDCLLCLLDGSLGLPAAAGAAGAAGASVTAPAAAGASAAATVEARASTLAAHSGIKETQGIPLRQPLQSAPQAAAAASAAAAGVGAGMPYVSLAGVLAAKYAHDAKELGGPVTEALAHAQASTTARVLELEGRCKSLHREVVQLKCTLAEARKSEAERVEAALRDQKRKIARREARQPTLLEKFLQTKWGPLFMGIGMADELPRVLRTTAPVNNKQMPKREAERLAREIWCFKDELDAANTQGARVTLAEATALFLERRFFAIPRLVTEVAYNLVYSQGQHTYDADCNLFLRVFSGEVDEAVRQEQQVLQAEVGKMLRLLDVSINHQATGWLHKADIKTALAGFFKGKKVDRLSEILEALDTDEPSDALHYSVLFSDDDDMNQSMTAEIIRSQHLAERLEFLQDIEDTIRDTAEDHGTTSLTPAMLHASLRKAHKSLGEAATASLLARAFGRDWQQQQHKLAQPLGTIIKAIRCGGSGAGGSAVAAPPAPLMLHPVPGVNSVAGAVSQIVPVGKFANRLKSALKVGFSKQPASAAAAGGGGRTQRQVGSRAATASGAADGGSSHAVLKQRRATQEAVAAAVAAALSGNGSKPGKKAASQAAAAAGEEQMGAADHVDGADGGDAAVGDGSDAAAAVDAASQDPAHAEGATGGSAGASSGGLKQDARNLSRNSRGTAGDNTVTLQHQPGSIRAPRADAGDFATASGGAAHHNADSQGVPAPSMHAHVSPTRGDHDAALAAALRVGVLSAMEAVRQSWLKEEEEKLVNTGSLAGDGAAAAAALLPSAAASGTGRVADGAAAGAAGQWLASLQGGAGAAEAAATVGAVSSSSQPGQLSAAGTAVADGHDARGGSRSVMHSSSGIHYSIPAIPAIPALRLSDIHQAQHYHAALSGAQGPTWPMARALDSTRSSSEPGSTYRSSMAGSAASTARSGSTGGAVGSSSVCGSEGTSARLDSQRSLVGQYSLKPSLMHDGLHGVTTPKASKRVQISTADTVFAFSRNTEGLDTEGAASGSSFSGGRSGPNAATEHVAPAVQQHHQQHQGLLRSALSFSASPGVTGRGAAPRAPAPWEEGVPSQSQQQQQSQPVEVSFLPHSDTTTTTAASHGIPAAPDGDAGGSPPSPEHGSGPQWPPSGLVHTPSSNSRGHSSGGGATTGSATQLAGPSRTQSMKSSRPGSAVPPAPASGATNAGSAPARSASRRGKSAKHASMLPQLQLLLTDADDACAAELASPMALHEHAQVCFTPQAPEQGGHRNAVLMRRLNKGKSLKALEEAMLAVASDGTLGG